MKRYFALICVLIGVFVVPRISSGVSTLSGRELHQVQLHGTSVPGLPGVKMISGQRLVGTLPNGKTVIQPNYPYRASFTPNDPQYPLQWNFVSIRANEAWDTVPSPYGGSTSVVVAVLDSGLAYEDYQSFKQVPDVDPARVWTNPNETASDGLDHDADGFTNDIHGWNFVDNTAHPDDDNGHGTHVANIIGAATNNGIAGAGLAFHVTIMPLKVLDSDGNGSTATISAAIRYAVNHGANVINLSLGGSSDDTILHQVITEAVAKGVVVVAATGNEGASTVNYPAKYSEVISVGAVQYDNTRAPYSNYGDRVDLVAPGGNTRLDQNNDGQPDGILEQTCATSACTSADSMYYSGTSQAAAHVTGAVALLQSCGLSSGNVLSTLASTAKHLGEPGINSQYGSGLIDVAAAMNAAGCLTGAVSSPGPIAAVVSGTNPQPIWSGGAYPYRAPSFSWTGPAGTTYRVAWKKDKTTLTKVDQTGTSFTPAPRIKTEGKYSLEVRAVGADGTVSKPVTFSYQYRAAAVAISTVAKTPVIGLYRGDASLIRRFTPPSGAAVSLSGGPLEKDSTSRIVTTTVKSGMVSIISTQGQPIRSFQPFDKNATLSVTLLQGGAGQAVIAVADELRGGSVAWYSSTGKLLTKKTVYTTYHRGLRLAAGDVNGDGQDELIVAQSKGAEVRVYNNTLERLVAFTPFGKTYSGGWVMATGDLNGDGRDEIILAPDKSTPALSVYILDQSGSLVKKLSLKTPTAKSPFALQSIDDRGDGLDNIVLVSRLGAIVWQQWDVNGHMYRQKALGLTSTATNITGLN